MLPLRIPTTESIEIIVAVVSRKLVGVPDDNTIRNRPRTRSKEQGFSTDCLAEF